MKSVICADDYGLTPAIGKAIRELTLQNKINAVSCMVNLPESASELKLLKKMESPIQIGLHLNFTVGKSQPFLTLLGRCFLRRIPAHKIESEILSQLEIFESYVGKGPNFIDGHQHVHQFPLIREALIKVLNTRYPNGNYPWVRVADLPPRTGFDPRLEYRNRVLIRAGQPLKKRLKENRIPTNRYLFGFIDPHSHSQREAMWKAFRAAGGNEDVFYCHPGYIDEALLTRDTLIKPRLEEFQFLRSL